VIDSVFDTTVVALSNKNIADRKKGNAFDRRLRLLEAATGGRVRIRYNSKLLTEYVDHVREHRNDVVDLFFEVLDSSRAIRVGRNTLSRQDHRRAVEQRWPNHDQHLLAAALGGNHPSIYVTEELLANCASGIHRVFRIRIHLV
jgi:hypothetical protein